MNPWSQKTLDLVTTRDYLDQLQKIYAHEEGERDVSAVVLDLIKALYERKDEHRLINELLGLEKFPYKDSYVGFLRKDRTAIGKNPDTVRRICDRLYSMGIENVIAGITQSKEANTRRGNQFSDWVKKSFKMVGLPEFESSTKGIVVLGGSELEGRDFCNKKLGVGISKRPDIVAKSGSRYVIGEAKFLSSTGGNQGSAFDDGIGLAMNSSGSAYKIFILDGVLWIEQGSDQFDRIDNTNATVISAILLEEYLKSI